MKTTKAAFMVGATLLLATGCTPGTAPEAGETTSTTETAETFELDPLTCYIAGSDRKNISKTTLQCGGGLAVSFDIDDADQAEVTDENLAGWKTGGAWVGINDKSDNFVRILIQNSAQRCMYDRTMSDNPQDTGIICRDRSDESESADTV